MQNISKVDHEKVSNESRRRHSHLNTNERDFNIVINGSAEI